MVEAAAAVYHGGNIHYSSGIFYRLAQSQDRYVYIVAPGGASVNAAVHRSLMAAVVMVACLYLCQFAVAYRDGMLFLSTSEDVS